MGIGEDSGEVGPGESVGTGVDMDMDDRKAVSTVVLKVFW